MIWLLTTEALILMLVARITVQARRAQRFHQLQQLSSVNSRAAVLRSRIHLVHSRSGRTQLGTPQQTMRPARLADRTRALEALNGCLSIDRPVARRRACAGGS
jgi:hypothetical protein